MLFVYIFWRSSSSDTEKRASRPATSKKIRSEKPSTTTRSSSTESTERLVIDEKNNSAAVCLHTTEKESEKITTMDTVNQDEPVINIQETGNDEMSDHSDIAENNDENRALIPGNNQFHE